ncbi:MAG: hypothetical protein IKP86_07335 [Anaerolineaceae bacterium]|nr:hypothetical protein [Anaerolineaceae bacterium]
MKKIFVLILALLCALSFAGCSKKSDSAEAVKPVEAFYNAIVSQNRDQVSSLVCSDWEKDALRDVDSFMGVKSELKGFSCTLSGEKDGEATVTCKGSIAASYGAEITEFPLENRTHKVIKEQGEWRLCGY